MVTTKTLIARIENDFTYHAPQGDQPKRYEALRAKAKEFALVIAGLTPQSREQSLALTKLEEVAMWANAAIARNETDFVTPGVEEPIRVRFASLAGLVVVVHARELDMLVKSLRSSGISVTTEEDRELLPGEYRGVADGI